MKVMNFENVSWKYSCLKISPHCAMHDFVLSLLNLRVVGNVETIAVSNHFLHTKWHMVALQPFLCVKYETTPFKSTY